MKRFTSAVCTGAAVGNRVPAHSLLRSFKHSGPRWPLSLKLDIALLGYRGLFESHHLSLHLGEFCGGLFVTVDEESCRPENQDSRCGQDVLRCGSPFILLAWPWTHPWAPEQLVERLLGFCRPLRGQEVGRA